MRIRNFLNGLVILSLASVSPSSFAAKSSSSYVDDEGYCVVNFNLSDKEKYIRQDVINVPDINQHVLRIFKTEKKISNTKLCNGDSLVSSHYYASSDYIDHDGAEHGYNIFTTQKGDKIFVQDAGNNQWEIGKGNDLAYSQITGRIIGGTGDFVTAEGDLQYKGTFNWKKEILNLNILTLRYKISSEDTKKEKS